MKHRHLSDDPAGDVHNLGLAELDDLLDRGDFEDWAPLAAAVAADPHGLLAERVLGLVDAHLMYGTSRLWRDWIERLREHSPKEPVVSLRDLRERAGLTQRQVASAMGVAQPDLSRLERRGDARLSTLRNYVRASGGRLRLVADLGDGQVELQLAGLADESEDGLGAG